MSNEVVEGPITEQIQRIGEILNKRMAAKEELRILELFRPLTAEHFVEVLHGIDLTRLLAALDRRRVLGFDARTEFLELLQGVVGGLNLEAKALLAQLLADGPTGYREEKVLRSLFLSETGPALTALKLKLDTSVRGHDLLHILTHDIDSPELRFDILKHFKESAEVSDSKARPLRVVSDIDDTLYSSLKDLRYPRGTLYPGVLELFSALSTQPVVFLTARRELMSALFERLTQGQLRRYGLKPPTVLSGSLPGLLGHRRMVEQKARTLISYTELYPEFRFVFFGDSGQGDTALSESLLKSKNSVIERAFIHKLSDLHPGAKTANPRIHLFEDYAVAAQRMQELGYLGSDVCSKIVSAVG